jgi:hypothetical protein
MRTSATRAAFTVTVSTLSALVACGGAAPPPPAVVAPAPATPPAPSPPDLSAVPDPAGLVLSGHLAKIGSTLGTVHGWSNLPMPQSEQLTELLTSEAIGPVVDVDQPVYFALTVVGSGLRMKPPMFAISAAVKDPDKVKATLADRYKLVPGDNGTTLIQGLGRPAHKADAAAQDDDDDDDDGKPAPGAAGSGGDDDHARTCELAASSGDAPVRIVCGLGKADVAALGPWLTRTAPRTAATADLHVDVRLAPLKDTIAQGKRLAGVMLGSILGGALRASWTRDLVLAAAGDAADFASDVDGLTLDLTLAESSATETATVSLSGTTSVLGRLAVAHPERSGAAPAAFWQMPADADFATFTRGMDDAAIGHARDLLTDAMGGGLVQDGAKAPDAKAVASAIGKLLTGAPIAYASGIDVAGVRKALATERAFKPDSDPAARLDARHATTEALLGWRVIEVDQPTAALVGAMKDLSSALSKPALLAALRAQNKDVAPIVLRSAPIAKAAGLPAGTMHWVLELPPPAHHAKSDAKKDAKKPEPAPKPVTVHVVMAPDGPRTWVGIGGDEAGVTSKLAASMATSGDNLGGRADLASFKTASVGTGGFFTARGLAQVPVQLRLLGGGQAFGVSQALDDLEQMPQKGVSPILFSSTAKAGGPPAVVTGQVTVPRGTIEDVVTTILRHGGF